MANKGLSADHADVLILGAGLGGLLAGVLLAKHGLKVRILEKNKQAGGCLQSFALSKKAFDSCVHYIGGLKEGHVLSRIFQYAGILDKLRLHELSTKAFDSIAFGKEDREYPIGNKEYFVDALAKYFPGKEAALQRYLLLLADVAGAFPLYNLRMGDANEKLRVAGLELYSTLQNTVQDPKLTQVLLGNSFLYAGEAHCTPLYLHALVMDSYLHSAHRVAPASSDITKLLVQELRAHGGELLRNVEVSFVAAQAGPVDYVESACGQRFTARHYISNIAPAALLPLVESPLIRPLYRSRIATQNQTVSCFMLNLVLAPGKVPYTGSNLYWNSSDDALAATHYQPLDWPANYAVFFTEDPVNKGFSDTCSILSYLQFEEVSHWADTESRSGAEEDRGRDYEAFKVRKAEQLLDVVSQRLPLIRGNIIAQSTASPLTYRDYTATPRGSLYGIAKDVHQPATTTIAQRTKIPNLMFTGQNINLHGVLGVSITALATAGELIGLEHLLRKVNSA